MDYSGKKVLITGGSRGIGKATALAFAAKGAQVGINYKSNREAAEQTLSELPGDGHQLFACDISQTAAPQQLISDFVAHYGRLDILVNNAGISIFHNVEDTFDHWNEAWQKLMQMNVITAANLTYWAAQAMKSNGGGKIVNVSSRGAFRGEPAKPAYAASKAALNAMSQSMAKALAKDQIYSYVVAPGFTETDMASKTLTEVERKALLAESPFSRMAQPDEVASGILALVNEGMEYASGAILDINGASYLRS
ncbi:SDR family NAD(P)-dependent oxidoreductase [Gilvibacter sp.]|uniref:SDR family NAD(P)-dependent oxidoreductase n=1 Tax=Gilvibacter sp. TaxID=2729997 RepID=UPI003F49E088